MKKTDVYWAWSGHTGFDLITGEPPEKLTTCIKNDPFFNKTEYGIVLECPAFGEQVRNTYVMRAAFDVTLLKTPNGSGYQCSHFDPVIYASTAEHIQNHEVYSWALFSDSTVNVTVSPPFMHKGCLPGATAKYDISKWYRCIGPVYMLEGKDKHVIKAGEPVLYVTFDRPVNLKKYFFTNALYKHAHNTSNVKFVKPRMSLDKLYNYFQNNKINKIISKEIKRNLV